MIYSVSEYSKKFLFQGKVVSVKTLIRKCENNLLPSGHYAKKLPGKLGQWIIEVADEVEEKKAEPAKSGRSLNSKHYSW